MRYFETYCNGLKGFLGVPQKDNFIAKYAVLLQTVSELWTICGQWTMWKYPSGSRGRPAKALARISVARVQIPPSTPYTVKRIFRLTVYFFGWNIRDLIVICTALTQKSDTAQRKGFLPLIQQRVW